MYSILFVPNLSSYVVVMYVILYYTLLQQRD